MTDLRTELDRVLSDFSAEYGDPSWRTPADILIDRVRAALDAHPAPACAFACPITDTHTHCSTCGSQTHGLPGCQRFHEQAIRSKLKASSYVGGEVDAAIAQVNIERKENVLSSEDVAHLERQMGHVQGNAIAEGVADGFASTGFVLVDHRGDLVARGTRGMR